MNKASLSTDSETLKAKDKKYLWHPFTQMQDWVQDDIIVIERASGMYLEDTDGRRYLDGVSSLWCNVHGHQVPAIDEAVRGQLGKAAHTTFLGLSNVPAIELAEKLIQIAPAGLQRVFYSDSGSEAVEIAVKMAYQYWQQKGLKKKKKFVKLSQSYHGDTIGSVSIGGIELFHQVYGPLLFETLTVPAPFTYRWPGGGNEAEVLEAALAELEKVLRENHEELAAFVMEPLMQGAAGMLRQPRGYIARARELTRKYNVLLIFDEVATGFGRTGKMFAAEHEQVTPDIMTLAKGLTGGYLPLAATLTTEEIYSAFLGEYKDLKTFFHGHTFTANPLACAAALASLRLFEENRVLEELQPKIELLTSRLKLFYDLPLVGDIRQEGFMVGIELVKDPASKEPFDWAEQIGVKVTRRAVAKGVMLRPLGPVVILMPPLAISKSELNTILDVTSEAIQEIAREL